MRALLIASLVALGLSACATNTLQPVPHKTSFTGFATLASSGTFEFTAAPTWTRLAALRHNAAKALRAQAITVKAAQHIQARADLARTLLDDAMAADKAGDAARARDKLRWAAAAIEDAEITLKGTP